MSTDPHAPTPAGADPNDAAGFMPPTEAHPAAGDEVASVAAGSSADTSPGTPVGEPERVTPAPDAFAPTPDPAPAPDPVIATPSAFTPPGTPEDEGPLAKAKAMAEGPLAQAGAVAERPEAQVGLAFLGGAVLSFVLKRFGR